MKYSVNESGEIIKPNGLNNNSVLWLSIVTLLIGIIVYMVYSSSESVSEDQIDNSQIKETVSTNKKTSVENNTAIINKTNVEIVFNRFIKAWNEKDYNTQISLLSKDFYYKDKRSSNNYSHYLSNKKRLFNKYKWISVNVSSVKIEINDDNAIVSYYQHYDSPYYESWGENRIYFKLVNGKIKIYKEVFNRDSFNSKQTIKKKDNIDNSDSELAVISDADGYTNFRAGKGTKYRIVDRLLSNEQFEVYPSKEKWWRVRTPKGKEGYIYYNRVDLLNREFYIINVTTTSTETEALKEVEKLENRGFNAGHLWIPNYKSLSGVNLYSVYIGPFTTQIGCERAVEYYKNINKKAYGVFVSQNNDRIEIRGINKIKLIKNYQGNSSSSCLFPQASQRELKDDDVNYLSKYELKIMRNEIFARYGHSFNPDGAMDKYFRELSWYTNRGIDATSMLSNIEKINIKLIKNYE